MKTIDEYVIKGLANENLELLLARIGALHLNLNLLINGVPQSATITTDTNIDKIKEKIRRYTNSDDITILSAEITSDFDIRIKYSYRKNDEEIKYSNIITINEAEDYGIEINYI